MSVVHFSGGVKSVVSIADGETHSLPPAGKPYVCAAASTNQSDTFFKIRFIINSLKGVGLWKNDTCLCKGHSMGVQSPVTRKKFP
ncbi:MAG: hypothetical protein K2I18_00275 [Paramuribaculum sp.]|nr:hypothetical protein [Paramuribaculum sp.]